MLKMVKYSVAVNWFFSYLVVVFCIAFWFALFPLEVLSDLKDKKRGK